MDVYVSLNKAMFSTKERELARSGELVVSGFLFDSGVAGLRLANRRGQLVLLPYQGQQIWSADFDGQALTMKSMFDQPRPTRTYLETYGGFLLHCGFTAMGVPAGEDTHPLHGELPNAPYDEASLAFGEDANGAYVSLRGKYTHTVAFGVHYCAEPEVRLYADSSIFRVSLTCTNLKRTPMEYMYLAHVNFRPVDHSRLIYSANPTPEHVRVRKSIPSHVQPKPGYREFLEQLARHPELHHVLEPELQFDPEVVFLIDYLADAQGWAHSLQIHPDGAADYIRHRPDQLNKGMRWICRTPDQDALGLNLPGTAEPEGYHAEKAKGNMRTLDGGESFHCDLDIGLLQPADALAVEEKIIRIIEKG